MKIAIHFRKGSFSDRWIEYCEMHNVPHKIVNCYDSDIIEQLKDCDALMWHHHHGDYKDALFAKSLLFSIEQAGIKVFPNFNTGWHFDDKIGQKYLLEAIGAPLVKSYVFYDKTVALKWAIKTTYPKVFKLRGGAGANNVQLIKDIGECKKIIKKSFSSGFSQFNALTAFKDRIGKFKKTNDFYEIIKGIARFFIKPEFAKMHAPEKGYVYFQDFIPNNSFDIRVIVIGNKAFAIKRMTRKNDFRASGSGIIRYSKHELDERCVEISFSVNKKLNSQSIAYDFVFDENNKPLIIEISYGFAAEPYDLCPGYWTSDLQWHQNPFNPQSWMLENILKQ